jgi:sugar phosphate isomerase/epimerase
VDTGWWATQGYDPVAAIHELSDRLFHVHLKDVEEPGTHVTCMHGEGCARIFDCVDALLDIGYAGPVSIEHHSFDRDPTPECARALTVIREQLAIHV